jgi:flagellar biosynthesis protein FlhF
MLLKRIEAATLPEALEAVRAACGDDALVVETRSTRRGYLVVAARPPAELPPGRAPRTGAPPPRWTRGFAPLAAAAADFGLSARILQAVENALLGTRVDLSRPGDPALPALCVRVLQSLIATETRFEGRPAAAEFRAVALVGATGVGKTTTLAKLAARAVADGQHVAIVTIDTWRVAAVEQLRAFADLLDLPLEVAFTPQDLRRALQQHARADRVFVDTTGRSPFDRDALAALGGALGGRGTARLLCMPAGTRRRDADLQLDAWDRLGIDGVCLTKWDETAVPGETVAALVERGLRLSHLGIGQEVPADLVAADAGQIARAAFDVEQEPAT